MTDHPSIAARLMMLLKNAGSMTSLPSLCSRKPSPGIGTTSLTKSLRFAAVRENPPIKNAACSRSGSCRRCWRSWPRCSACITILVLISSSSIARAQPPFDEAEIGGEVVASRPPVGWVPREPHPLAAKDGLNRCVCRHTSIAQAQVWIGPKHVEPRGGVRGRHFQQNLAHCRAVAGGEFIVRKDQESPTIRLLVALHGHGAAGKRHQLLIKLSGA